MISGDRAKTGRHWQGRSLVNEPETGRQRGIFHRFPPACSHVRVNAKWKTGGEARLETASEPCDDGRGVSTRPLDAVAQRAMAVTAKPVIEIRAGRLSPARRRPRLDDVGARKGRISVRGTGAWQSPQAPRSGGVKSVARPAMRRQPER